jgi:hypothetical protein
LILGLANAPPEVIARDYTLTRIGTEPFRDHLLGVMLSHLRANGIDNPFEMPGFEELCGVRGATILAILDWMGEKWGGGVHQRDSNALYPGVQGYLTQELGFSVEEVERIKKGLAA